ncbi:lysylphosphatidylglycerol synthase domain-containing protein [Gryllotalpicola protaetiae]|uniref:Uncharacterized protein n=1 Tax=Gryllotalpicola protaetiae TaxID=2419771 RepID=A0A387BPX1_9MICO|nr:lysylphosphatidylglycerol synthase domain-containing protein [Gryllotalpicola protaetiae]AYG03060.1 hypothetical protein D7I44_05645 [Gryllotalpicola protaetiae]
MTHTSPGTPPPTGQPATRSVGTRWAIRLALLVLAALVVIAAIRLVRNLDFATIGGALERLTWWQLLGLLGVLLIRQVLSATPLRVYIPDISLWRATVNDLSAMTAAAFAPAPSDIALRIAIFTSWGVPTPTAVAGSVLNALSLFIVRFAAPLGGFALIAIVGEKLGVRAIDLLSLAVSAALVTMVVLVARAESSAVRIGRWGGRVARRVRRGVDPESWGEAFAAFQRGIAGNLRRRLPRGLLGVAAMILADLTLLTLALRFVGVDPSEASLVTIAAAFFFAYPLTLFPVQGAGVVDVAILLALSAASGDGIVETATAGLLIWRAYTIAGSFLLGAIAVLVWRGGVRRRRQETPAEAAASSGRPQS